MNREKNLDNWILFSGILGILGSLAMFGYLIAEGIGIYKPYLLYFIILLLSIMAIKYWKKETYE